MENKELSTTEGAKQNLKSLLVRSLSTEFLEVLKQNGLTHDVIEAFLGAVSVESNVSTLLAILSHDTSPCVHLQISKQFRIPIGLSTIMFQMLRNVLFEPKPGRMIINSVFVLAEISPRLEFTVIYGKDDVVLSAKIYTQGPENDEYAARCNQWIGLGFHAHIVSAYFTRSLASCDRLILFTEDVSSDCVTLYDHFGTISTIESAQLSEVIMRYIVSLCRAIDFAHSSSVNHLDIHPANILLVPQHQPGRSEETVGSEQKWKVMITNFRVNEIVSQDDANGLYRAPEMYFVDCVTDHVDTRAKLPLSTPGSPSDVYALGMVFLDLIRGYMLSEQEVSSLYSSVPSESKLTDDMWSESRPRFHAQFITTLVDKAFSASRLPHRRVYPLLPLLEQCLHWNPGERPTVQQLLLAAQDAYKYCNLSPPLPPPLPSISSDSVANLSNMAIGDAEAGFLTSARSKFIAALSSDPSNIHVLWNLSLFRWRVGEIDPIEFVTILRRHELIFGDESSLSGRRKEDWQSNSAQDNSMSAFTSCAVFSESHVSELSTDTEDSSAMVSSPTRAYRGVSEDMATAETDQEAITSGECGHVSEYESYVQAVCAHSHLCRLPCESAQHDGQGMIYGLYASSFAPSAVTAYHQSQLPVSPLFVLSRETLFSYLDNAQTLCIGTLQACSRMQYDRSCGAIQETIQQRDDRDVLTYSGRVVWGNGIWTYLDESIDSIGIDVEEFRRGTLVLAIAEILHHHNTPLFVERVVGCDVRTDRPSCFRNVDPCGITECYILLEGQYEHDDYGSGWNQADVESVVEEDDIAPTYSSEGSHRDSNLTPAPPKRHYFLVTAMIQGDSAVVAISGVLNVDGIYFDQRPTAIRLMQNAAAMIVIYGTGGLLCAVSPPTTYDRGITSAVVQHLVIDKYICSDEMSVSDQPFPVTHTDHSTITSIHFAPLSSTLVSGDSCGDLCAWQYRPGGFGLMAEPLHLTGRIHNLVQSDLDVQVVVCLDWRVVLVGLHTESQRPSLYIRSVLDTASQSVSPDGHRLSPPRYEMAFFGKEILLWRISTADPGISAYTRGRIDQEGGALDVNFIRVPNPHLQMNITSGPCTYRLLSVDTYKDIAKMKASIRTQNETIFQHINNEDYEEALYEVNDFRLFQKMRYNNDLLTWLVTIAEKVSIDVNCDTHHPGGVRFISIDSLDSCRSPTISSDIDVVSMISASMNMSVKGPILPLAVASSGDILAAATRSMSCKPDTREYESSSLSASSDERWEGRVVAQTDPILISLYSVPSRAILYSITEGDLFRCQDVWTYGSIVAKGEKHIHVLSPPTITTMEFSKNSRYLLIASSHSNSTLSTVCIWCCKYRKVISKLSHVDGIVRHARWSHSDILVTLFFSEDNFATYILDWPHMTASQTARSRPRLWAHLPAVTASERITTHSSNSDSLSLRCSQDVWRDCSLLTSSNEGAVDAVISSHQFFRSLGGSEQVPCLRNDLESTNTSVTMARHTIMKSAVSNSVHSWLRYGGLVSASTPTVGRKVCLLYGEPYCGKSDMVRSICVDHDDYVLARVLVRREGMLEVSPNCIAYEVLCSVSQQLYSRYGTRYSIPVIRELSDELRLLCDLAPAGHPLLGHRSTAENLSRTGVIQPKPAAPGHARNFSIASSIGTIESGSGSSFDDESACIDRLLSCTCRALRLTTEEASALHTPITVVPDTRRLSVSRLFSILIGVPLSELQPLNHHTVICLDGMDVVDSSATYTHLQSVIDMLIHNTPDWCRILMTSRSPSSQMSCLSVVPAHCIRVDDTERHSDDLFVLCTDLLVMKGYTGDTAEAARQLYSHSEGSVRNISLLEMTLPAPLSEEQLQISLHGFDVKAFNVRETFPFHGAQHFQRAKRVMEVLAAAFESPTVSHVADALMDFNADQVTHILQTDLTLFFYISDASGTIVARNASMLSWLRDGRRLGSCYQCDVLNGHNALSALYLRHCGNKSIAVDHPWQAYLKTYGPSHIHRASRGLRLITRNVRKLDETCGITGPLPHQLGYLENLQELYARRVGIYGPIPKEFGCLSNMRVLSMGNNRISGALPASLGKLKNLQRIVLHQNKLCGYVPDTIWNLGCIVNLAGNPFLQHGPDVPPDERSALAALYTATNGPRWSCNRGWMDANTPVAKWYKVGVLGSRVHSIVMSSNNMTGTIPPDIAKLAHLRMIELATMSGLTGPLSIQLCSLRGLRRLCICRCGLSGKIPVEIGNLVELEELQLFGNSLSGRIPDSLSKLTSLRLLSLGEYTGGNNFAPDVIPSCISSLVRLEALFMANCHLRGQLPDWIGSLTELRQLDLQRNNFRGTLPPSIGNLSNILYLNLKDNHELQGPLPVLQLARLTKLNRLSLVHCRFNAGEDVVNDLQSRLPRCRVWV